MLTMEMLDAIEAAFAEAGERVDTRVRFNNGYGVEVFRVTHDEGFVIHTLDKRGKQFGNIHRGCDIWDISVICEIVAR